MENTPLPSPTSSPTPPQTEKKSSPILIILVVLIALLLGLGLIIYYFLFPYFKEQPSLSLPSTISTIPLPPSSPAPSSSNPVSHTPSSEPLFYTTLEQDFPELINNTTGLFSPTAKQLLKKNGFVAIPGDNQEFFNLYTTNNDQHIPNFITTDSVLHTAELVFSHLSHTGSDLKAGTADFLNNTLEQLQLSTITPEYLPATFGSSAAQQILTTAGTPLPSSSSTSETNPRRIGPITMAPESYDIYPLLPLIATKPGNLPSFMTNEAWSYKDLNTFLGAWTDMIASSTTSTTVAMIEGIGGPDDEIQTVDDRGYVEPEPIVYQRIAEISKQIREQLEKNKQLSATDRTVLISLEKTCMTLTSISQSEINKIPLTEDAHQFIKNYGNWLQNVWEQIYSKELAAQNGSNNAVLVSHPAATLATAATLPNGTILQTGTGKVFDLFVIVTVNGKQKLAHGGIYSYYEFTKSKKEYLTPTSWRALVSNSFNESPPKPPSWTDIFLDSSVIKTTK